MPHRKNAKGDIGTAKKWSDSYDADNIYLSEEGWVYRHFKNTERSRWWDEIIVSGQVKPNHIIGNTDNGDSILGEASGTYNEGVLMTNPFKLGVIGDVNFQTGDGYNDYRYSDHSYDTTDGTGSVSTLSKYVIEKNDTYSGTGFDQIAWESIDVSGTPTAGDLTTQVPESWTDVSSPKNPNPELDEGGDYESVNQYTLGGGAPTAPPPPTFLGWWEKADGSGLDSTVGAGAGDYYNDSIPLRDDDEDGATPEDPSAPDPIIPSPPSNPIHV